MGRKPYASFFALRPKRPTFRGQAWQKTSDSYCKTKTLRDQKNDSRTCQFLKQKWCQNGANMVPKWSPEASRTCVEDGRQLNRPTNRQIRVPGRPSSAPRVPPDDFGRIFLPHRYPRGIRRVSDGPNFAHRGPWGRTIIKEYRVKQLKHRHASGRWPGEFSST